MSVAGKEYINIISHKISFLATSSAFGGHLEHTARRQRENTYHLHDDDIYVYIKLYICIILN